MKRVVSALLLVVLCVTPLSAFAQDEPKLESYTSDNGLFSMMYPADWVVEGMEDGWLPGATVANTQDALDHANSEDGQLQSGDKAVLVMVLPMDFFSLAQVELPEDPTVMDMVTLIAETFLAPDPEDTAADPESIVVGEPEEIMLGEDEDIAAGYVTAQDSTAEGVFIVHALDEDNTLLALTVAYAAPGEFTDELAALGKAVAGTVSYTGTSEDIMSVLMGGVMDEGSGDTGSTGATQDGATLVQERCTVCHSTGRIDQADKDEAGWTSTVDRMISHGAQLNADERQAVIDYLVATH